MSTTYQKIPGPFKRDPETNRLTREWSSPEIEALVDTEWIFTEKIDGTNIRVIWDGYAVSFGGRTDNAQIPPRLLEHLENRFGGPEREQLFEQKFGATPAVLYGEGFGEKIQGGGAYGPVSFSMFDVRVDGIWLQRENVLDVASYFGVATPPLLGFGTLRDAVEHVEDCGLASALRDGMAEGAVGVTSTGLLNRRGERVMVKVKVRDLWKVSR